MPPVTEQSIPHNRLPPGSSEFHHWDGKKWMGELHVLGEIIRAEASSKLGLITKLDKRYRQWLKDQPMEIVQQHTEHLQ